MRRPVRFVFFLSILFLAPLLAMEDEKKSENKNFDYDQQLRRRLQEAEKEKNSLLWEIFNVLKAKEDLPTLTLKYLEECPKELPDLFKKELNLLKISIKPLENLFTEEELDKLGSRKFCPETHLKPLDNIISGLAIFNNKWKKAAASVQALHLAMKYIKRKWPAFASKTNKKLENKEDITFSLEEILEIYHWIAYFHKQTSLLPTLEVNLLTQPKNEILLPLKKFQGLQKNSSHSEPLLRKNEEKKESLKNLKSLPPEQLKDVNLNGQVREMAISEATALWNILATCLATLSEEEGYKNIEKFLTKDYSAVSEKGYTQKSLILTFLEKIKTKHQGNAIIFKKEEVKKLTEQPLWIELEVPGINLMAGILQVTHYLEEIASYYKYFRIDFLKDISVGCARLDPQALLWMPGHVPCNIIQEKGRDVGYFDSNGFICFGRFKQPKKEGGGGDGTIGVSLDSILFKRRRTNVFNPNTQITSGTFEKIFGIPSEQIVPITITNITIIDPPKTIEIRKQNSSTKALNVSTLTEYYIPEQWKANTTFVLATGQKKFIGATLANLLEKGDEKFETLEDHSVGMHILLSLLTQSWAFASDYGLVEKEGKFILKKLAHRSSLQPAFAHIRVWWEEGNNSQDQEVHQLVEKNPLLFLPQAKQEILKSVKESFLRPSFYLTLCAWLAELNKYQNFYSPFIKNFNLNEQDKHYGKKNEEEQISFTKTQAEGLEFSFRLKAFQTLIDNYEIIKELLSEKGITYWKILEKLDPQKAACYGWVKGNPNKKKEEEDIEKTTLQLQLDRLYDDANPIIFEKIKQEQFPKKRDVIDCLTGASSPLIAGISESNQKIDQIAGELAHKIDFSSLPLPISIKIMDILLGLTSLERVPPKWQKVVNENSSFLALPPRVENFFDKKVFNATSKLQKTAQEKVQLEVSRKPANSDKSIEINFSLPSPEEQAATLFYKLWKRSYQPCTQKNLFKGILDLLLLPGLTSENKPIPSLGFASCAISQEGPTVYDLETGNHFVLSYHPSWLKFICADSPIPLDMRQALLSQNSVLLCLQWLKEIENANFEFHPWFMGTLFKKTQKLQDKLTSSLSLTFTDLIRALWPDLYSAHQQKLDTHQENLKEALNNILEVSKPFDKEKYLWKMVHPGKKRTLFDILKKWDTCREFYAFAPPHTLGDAATICLDKVNLNTTEMCGQDMVAAILKLASLFPIDIKKMTSRLGADVLEGYLEKDTTPSPTLNLLLRLYFRSNDVEVTDNSLKISNTAAQPQNLAHVAARFPKITKLDLSNNQIISVKPLVKSVSTTKTLKDLPNLEILILDGNPFHNHKPLEGLTSLTSLSLKDTFICKYAFPERLWSQINIQEEKKPINKEPQPFDTIQSLALTPCKEFQKIQNTDSPKLIKQLDENLSIERLILLLHHLGEDGWLGTLPQTMSSKVNHNGLYDKLFEQIKKEEYVRPSAFRILFSLKFGLPMGAQPTFLFAHPIPNALNPGCLKTLEIKNTQCLDPIFFKWLGECKNLQKLSLTNAQLSDFTLFPCLLNLRVLKLSNNLFSDLSDLRRENNDPTKFPNLRVFNLNKNQIKKLTRLKDFSKLKVLRFKKNQLTDMPKVTLNEDFIIFDEKLKLDTLDISENFISNVEGKQNKKTGKIDFIILPQNNQK